MTKSLDELLKEIETRAESATPVRYKVFPLTVVGDDESQKLMNEYTALGMMYCTDIPKMAAVIRKLIEQRHERSVFIFEHGYNDDRENEYNAELAKIWEGGE